MPLFLHTPHTHSYLACKSRELEHMNVLVKDGGGVGNVHKHCNFSLAYSLPFANKVVLEQTSQLALTKWYHSLLASSVWRSQQCVCACTRETVEEASSRVCCRSANYKTIVQSYFLLWLYFMASIHFPRVSKELLMFPASLTLIPVAPVLAERSAPARSTMEILREETEVRDYCMVCFEGV